MSSTIPSTGPVPVGGVVSIWALAPATPHIVGTKLRLAPGTYVPSSQTFPAANSTNFPLSKFLGLSYNLKTTLSTVGTGAWVSTITGSAHVLVIAGGGSGGASYWGTAPTGPNTVGGGGGAGGYMAFDAPFIRGTPYAYTIGAGGVATGPGTNGVITMAKTPGSPSSIKNQTAIGGGCGTIAGFAAADPGGSGGGAGGAGTTGQGFPGGAAGSTGPTVGRPSGGGGGGGGNGGNGPIPTAPTSRAVGGNGYTWPYNSVTYCGGGGGGVGSASIPVYTQNAGGPGGGGASGIFGGAGGVASVEGKNGTVYGAGGGGGSGVYAPSGSPAFFWKGGNGYQGAIIIYYP
jgi:hypothetical protein